MNDRTSPHSQFDGAQFDHAHFEELSAIAAVGQLSEAEFDELSRHLRQCTPCRDSYAEFANLAQNQRPLAVGENLAVPKPSLLELVKGNEYQARFRAVAAERGFKFSDRTSGRQTNMGPVAAASADDFAALAPSRFCRSSGGFACCVGVLVRRSKEIDAHNVALAEVSRLQSESEGLRHEVGQLSRSKQDLGSDLARTENSSTDLATRLQEAQAKLDADEAALESLRVELASSKNHGAETEMKLQEAQQKLQGLTRPW